MTHWATSTCRSARRRTITTVFIVLATASLEKVWSAWMREPACASGIFNWPTHGLWDYDLPCAPNLIDIRVDGKPVKADAHMSKQRFFYVFDPVTVKPLWPIEENPIPH